jgi:hypothetical protein
MEADQKNIEGIVLPLFGLKNISSVAWGKWSTDHMMCSFGPLTVDGKQYVIVQDELDGFPDDREKQWLAEWRNGFQLHDFDNLPFTLEHPVKALKPNQTDEYHNAYVVCLEQNPSSLNFYMLFEG